MFFGCFSYLTFDPKIFRISKKLSKNNISFEFKNGIRKTSLEMMNIVQKVLDNRVNKEISDLISIWGGKTTRLVGAKNSPINAVIDSNKKLGQVGLIRKVDKRKILSSFELGKIPIISPVGWTSKKFR